MSSIDIIHKIRRSKWPVPDLTLEDDLIDLCWHQREFEFNSSFAFTVMNEDETKCLGCIYLYPPELSAQNIDYNDNYDVKVSWWVTQQAYNQGFYEILSKDIKAWIEQKWPFKKILWANKELPEDF